MKHLTHHSIIITCKNEKLIKAVKKKILELITSNTSVKNSTVVVSEPTKSITNEFYTLYVSPDGSKEGYDISFELDNARAEIVNFLKMIEDDEKEASLFTFVELKFGDGIEPEIMNYG